MEKARENTDIISTALGLISIFIVILVANKLLEPIKGRQDHELAGEKFHGFFKGLANTIYEALGKPAVPVENTYSFFLNLLIPFLLVCLACVIATFVVYHLVKSFGDYEDSVMNHILKIIFILLFLIVICFLIPVAWHLLLLNFKVLFSIFLIVALFFGVILYRGKSA